jgi:nicotinate-nucleotide adenylyltransferase
VINKNKTFFKNNIASCFSYLRKRKIGILGGSFNPPHAGHLHISETAKISLGLDEVWWLVAPQNRLKSSLGMESFSKRLNQARTLTQNLHYIKVFDLEQKNKLFISYQTAFFLTKKSQKAKFIWLMGSDILKNFSKWIKPSLISKKMPVAVIERPGYSYSVMNSKETLSLGKRLKSSKSKTLYFKKKPTWVFIKKQLLAISSTEIRNLNSKKQTGQ